MEARYLAGKSAGVRVNLCQEGLKMRACPPSRSALFQAGDSRSAKDITLAFLFTRLDFPDPPMPIDEIVLPLDSGKAYFRQSPFTCLKEGSRKPFE